MKPVCGFLRTRNMLFEGKIMLSALKLTQKEIDHVK